MYGNALSIIDQLSDTFEKGLHERSFVRIQNVNIAADRQPRTHIPDACVIQNANVMLLGRHRALVSAYKLILVQMADKDRKIAQLETHLKAVHSGKKAAAAIHFIWLAFRLYRSYFHAILRGQLGYRICVARTDLAMCLCSDRVIQKAMLSAFAVPNALYTPSEVQAFRSLCSENRI